MSTPMPHQTEVHRVLFSEEIVNAAIVEMAHKISADFAGEDITLVGVLNGGIFLQLRLATELERQGKIKGCHFDFVRMSSYRGERTAGALTLTDFLQENISGKNAIIVDDVGDTLNTLARLREHLLTQNPRHLKIAVLLEKPDKHVRPDVPLDYVGIAKNGIGFVYGCGMDLEGAFRALPFIAEATTKN